MTPDEFLERRREQTRVVPCEGHDFFLRPLVAGDKREISEWLEANGGTAVEYQILYVRSVCDASGQRYFGDGQAAVVAEFLLDEVEDVIDQVLKLNRLGKYAGKKASTTTPSSSSSSA